MTTIFAVEYRYDISRTSDLETLRPKHREFLKGLHEAGMLIASGPWMDAAAPGALLLVRGDSHDAVMAALDPDPFHRAHLITKRSARAWQPSIGSIA